mmetsp:Transcript_94833/g.210835  ORF Transcript_94833/g.210835 Transcript_94833/m.210835 type:complete len:285 (+) Transcript_94833:574-1428(+)
MKVSHRVAAAPPKGQADFQLGIPREKRGTVWIQAIPRAIWMDVIFYAEGAPDDGTNTPLRASTHNDEGTICGLQGDGPIRVVAPMKPLCGAGIPEDRSAPVRSNVSAPQSLQGDNVCAHEDHPEFATVVHRLSLRIDKTALAEADKGPKAALQRDRRIAVLEEVEPCPAPARFAPSLERILWRQPFSELPPVVRSRTILTEICPVLALPPAAILSCDADEFVEHHSLRPSIRVDASTPARGIHLRLSMLIIRAPFAEPAHDVLAALLRRRGGRCALAQRSSPRH